MRSMGKGTITVSDKLAADEKRTTDIHRFICATDVTQDGGDGLYNHDPCNVCSIKNLETKEAL
jgi:hypothetical protein